MTNEQKNFIEKIGALAQKDMQKSKILASLTIAQAILESNWGKSGLTVKANALFGIKATGWSGKIYSGKTQECYDGKTFVTITDAFRAYNSWEESVADHSKLLTSAVRYKNLIGETDYKKACTEIQKAGYATAPNYATSLISLIETYDLKRFDKGLSTVSTAKPVDKSSVTGTVNKYATGDKVTISKYAKNYAGNSSNTPIPTRNKGVVYTISQVKADGSTALLKEIYSWVKCEDLIKV